MQFRLLQFPVGELVLKALVWKILGLKAGTLKGRLLTFPSLLP